jgi:hypothetical protein
MRSNCYPKAPDGALGGFRKVHIARTTRPRPHWAGRLARDEHELGAYRLERLPRGRALLPTNSRASPGTLPGSGLL